jgi:hypothetical protein
MTYQLIDFEDVTFEYYVNGMIITLYFRVNDTPVNNCELEKVTGMSMDELIVKMAKGDIKVVEQGDQK